MTRTLPVVLLALTVTAPSLAVDLLWENGMDEEWRWDLNGRALSPPTYPDIRVVDDFVVPPGESWRLQHFDVHVAEFAGWEGPQPMQIYLRALDPETGGPVEGIGNELASFETGFEREETFSVEWWTGYYYLSDAFELVLGPGRYWIGLRNPNGRGGVTNYWLTGYGGDGVDTPAWFSMDAGDTFTPAGSGWDHQFRLRGEVIPEPTSGLVLLVLTTVGLAVRPRMRRPARG
jgi:hypothetical protein